eukprot:460214_1
MQMHRHWKNLALISPLITTTNTQVTVVIIFVLNMIIQMVNVIVFKLKYQILQDLLMYLYQVNQLQHHQILIYRPPTTYIYGPPTTYRHGPQTAHRRGPTAHRHGPQTTYGHEPTSTAMYGPITT